VACHNLHGKSAVSVTSVPTVEELRQVLGAKGSSAKCPAHDDGQASLSIGGMNGKPLLKCHAGCTQSAVIEALQAKGIWPKQTGITVADLAAAKSLPEELLRESGFADHEARGLAVIQIQYRDARGHVICTRYRGGGDGPRFWFRKGDHQQLYGLWRLRAEPVIVVEGETDSMALWADGFNAIGVPGAEAWKDDRFAGHLDRCPVIFVHVEPDGGGEKFKATFERSRLRDRVEFFTVAPAAKDPCELRARDIAGFRVAIETALANATAPASQVNSAAADPLNWLEEYEMTDSEAHQIADPAWIEPGLIADGHVVAIVAKPNGGKTTIMFYLACEWARAGRRVVYIHADTNPADAKRMREIAMAHGVRYLTPDFKVGKSMANVVENLESLAASNATLHGQIWLFDTLKKMSNVIHKSSLRQTMMMLRKLSSRGMTCILLAHTNKYRNADGEWQYEGTGDLEADLDELIYFEPRENPDGSLTVSTRCAKRRAEIAELTWDIARNRTVTRRTEYVDVASEAAALAQREKDEPAIEAICAALATGAKKQLELIAQCREFRLSEKRVRAVLKSYTGVEWRAERLFKDNAWRYELLERKTQ
jgi:AAA domain